MNCTENFPNVADFSMVFNFVNIIKTYVFEDSSKGSEGFIGKLSVNHTNAIFGKKKKFKRPSESQTFVL